MNWIKVHNSLPGHPKIVQAGEKAAWLYVCGLCYANEHLTDGFLSRAVLGAISPGSGRPTALAKRLVEVGLWHDTDGGWQIHDYTEVQRTAAQVKEIRRVDRERKHGSANAEQGPDPNGNPVGIQTESSRNPDDLARSQEKRREEQDLTPLSGERSLAPTVRSLFAYWQQRCRHPQARLTAERRRKCEARLREGYTEEQGRTAIDGAARAAFVNDQGKRFDDFELIFRSGSKLESFVERAKLNGVGPAAAPDAERVAMRAALAANRTSP